MLLLTWGMLVVVASTEGFHRRACCWRGHQPPVNHLSTTCQPPPVNQPSVNHHLSTTCPPPPAILLSTTCQPLVDSCRPPVDSYRLLSTTCRPPVDLSTGMVDRLTCAEHGGCRLSCRPCRLLVDFLSTCRHTCRPPVDHLSTSPVDLSSQGSGLLLAQHPSE